MLVEPEPKLTEISHDDVDRDVREDFLHLLGHFRHLCILDPWPWGQVSCRMGLCPRGRIWVTWVKYHTWVTGFLETKSIQEAGMLPSICLTGASCPRDKVPSPFDVLCFVSLGDLCGYQTKLTRYYLQILSMGGWKKRSNRHFGDNAAHWEAYPLVHSQKQYKISGHASFKVLREFILNTKPESNSPATTRPHLLNSVGEILWRITFSSRHRGKPSVEKCGAERLPSPEGQQLHLPHLKPIE